MKMKMKLRKHLVSTNLHRKAVSSISFSISTRWMKFSSSRWIWKWKWNYVITHPFFQLIINSRGDLGRSPSLIISISPLSLTGYHHCINSIITAIINCYLLLYYCYNQCSIFIKTITVIAVIIVVIIIIMIAAIIVVIIITLIMLMISITTIWVTSIKDGAMMMAMLLMISCDAVPTASLNQN